MFTEPEENNYISIIAQVLSSCVGNSGKKAPGTFVTIALITNNKISNQF